MKVLNTTPRAGFLPSLFFLLMRIKPTYDKSYLVKYKRNKDVQTTEIVEASKDDVFNLISQLFKGRFNHPDIQDAKDSVDKLLAMSKIPYTTIQVWELDNLKKKSTLCRTFPHIYNQSPRQVRINIEMAIKNQQAKA